MKVTHRIESSVRNSVYDKFAPLYEEIDAKYSKKQEQFEERILAAKDTLHSVIKNTFVDMLGDSISDKEKDHIMNGFTTSYMSTPNMYRRRSRSGALYNLDFYGMSIYEEKKGILRNIESKTIEDILVMLDGGGTLKDLNETLANLNPTLESLGIE